MNPLVRSSRRALRAIGAPSRVVLVALIRAYQLTLSGALGGQCRFYPSCSNYALEAVRLHGAAKGSALAAWRILRCAPWTAGGIDRVPPASHPDLVGAGYESVIQRTAEVSP